MNDKKAVIMSYVNMIITHIVVAHHRDGDSPREIWSRKTVQENADMIMEDYCLGQSSSFDYDEFLNAASFVDANLERLFDATTED